MCIYICTIFFLQIQANNGTDSSCQFLFVRGQATGLDCSKLFKGHLLYVKKTNIDPEEPLCTVRLLRYGLLFNRIELPWISYCSAGSFCVSLLGISHASGVI